MNKKRCKIYFVCTEDWFFYSHFLPLVKAANHIGNVEISLVTTCGKNKSVFEEMGVNVICLNFHRASAGGWSGLGVLRGLIKIFSKGRPDIIHFIALKPVLIGGIARLLSPRTKVIYHVTGLGTLAEGSSRRKRLARTMIFRLPALYMKVRNSVLFVENPDDVAYLKRHGMARDVRATILGGAGVDPEAYCPQPVLENEAVRIAFVGRMIATKGIDVLIRAMDILRANGTSAQLDLYGKADRANPGSYRQEILDEWNTRSDVNVCGYLSDVLEIWKEADICVVPTRTREGMPRAMLEAASCAKPLIVTDVPGCRHFVRDGVEGFVVPPEDPEALAKAMGILSDDAKLRKKMGDAARLRVLEAFTEQHVIGDISAVYKRFLQ